MFDETEFRTKIIALVKTMFPTLPVVKRFQNKTQVADISASKPMMDLIIERVIPVGTDYPCRTDSAGNTVWHGERLVQLSFELFAPNSLSMLISFKDQLETYAYREYMVSNGYMSQRGVSEPKSSTRIHGETQFIESAIYTDRFHYGIEYIDGVGNLQFAIPDTVPNPDEFTVVGSIEHGEISGNVEEKTITISY